MTQHRELAVTIARKIFDRIERDKTLILQNLADEIHDALLLEDAKHPKFIVSVDPATYRDDRTAAIYRELKKQWGEMRPTRLSDSTRPDRHLWWGR